MRKGSFAVINIQPFCSMGNIDCSVRNKSCVFLGRILMKPPPSFSDTLRLRVKGKKEKQHSSTSPSTM